LRTTRLSSTTRQVFTTGPALHSDTVFARLWLRTGAGG